MHFPGPPSLLQQAATTSAATDDVSHVSACTHALQVDSVAAADAANFRLHPSVEYWANYNTSFSGRSLNAHADDPAAPSALAADAAQLLRSSALADAESAAYWAYHLGRTGFFLGAAASGAIAHHLSTQLRALAAGSSPSRTPFQNLSDNASTELSNRLYEALAVYKQDLESIKQGAFKLPWDMTTVSHRQYNPLFVLSKSAQFVAEGIATLNRRMAQGSADNWFQSNLYPKYYADNTFHYQSDGWMSDRCGAVYEFSTETLFFGRQDAMQRSALLPLSQHIRENGLDPGLMRVMEACCGTGRFHTFLKDNHPSMSTICADLSPFYLARARDNVAYWKSQRAPALDLGGMDGTGELHLAMLAFMQCAVESVPLPDGSLDAVICMYAFHEMPEEARSAAVSEMFRLLKPGGLAVLTDSVQLGDRPQWDPTLGAFGNFNEPHYKNFIACDFGALFKAAGFKCGTKIVASASKTLSFVKPHADNSHNNNGDRAAEGASVTTALYGADLN
ncbi:S-adenosyl-L-methionine-dependent methyltransferase [Scenedesmus sp. NREL 46B-D3]|nr:S-adenosyl-L-methionine-dependent methyltransferase [Scenedesmus sp. NREL 46B-D3]